MRYVAAFALFTSSLCFCTSSLASSPDKTDLNLMGIWKLEDDPSQQLRIGQPESKLLIVALAKSQWGAGRLLYYGDYDNAAGELPVMKPADYVGNNSDRQKILHPPLITVVDADTIVITPDPNTPKSERAKSDLKYIRAASPIPNCQPGKGVRGQTRGWVLEQADKFFSASNYEAAACSYLQGSLMGGGRAPAALGALFLEGKGVKQDSSQALVWFEQSALQNNYLAERNLAHMYAAGIGTSTPDADKAEEWNNRADEQLEKSQQQMSQQQAAYIEAQKQDLKNALILFGVSVFAHEYISNSSLKFTFDPFACGNPGRTGCVTAEMQF